MSELAEWIQVPTEYMVMRHNQNQLLVQVKVVVPQNQRLLLRIQDQPFILKDPTNVQILIPENGVIRGRQERLDLKRRFAQDTIVVLLHRQSLNQNQDQDQNQVLNQEGLNQIHSQKIRRQISGLQNKKQKLKG